MQHGLSRRNDRDRVANGEAPKKWMFPLNSVRWKPEVGSFCRMHLSAHFCLTVISSPRRGLGRLALLAAYEMGNSTILCGPTGVRCSVKSHNSEQNITDCLIQNNVGRRDIGLRGTVL